MNCEQIHDLLNEYVDGELAAADREAVERHLADCAGCREELRALRQTAEMVRSLPHVRAPEGMVDAVKSRAARAAAIRKRAALARWVSVGGWVAAAATLLVVVKLASWTPELAAPDSKARPVRPTGKVAAPAPEARSDSVKRMADETSALPAPSDDLKEAEEVVPTCVLAKDDSVAPAASGVCEAADAAPPAPGRVLAGEREHPTGEQRRAKPTLSIPADAEERGAAKPAAPASALRDRAEAGNAREKVRKAEDPIQELVYLCKDTASGLAEVRRLVLAVGGTVVEAKDKGSGRQMLEADESRKLVEAKSAKKEGEAADHVILASVPSDRLAWLAARLKQAGEPGPAGLDAVSRSANGAKAAAGPEAFGSGGAAEGQAGAGKPDAVAVRIVLKIKPE